MCSGTVPTGYGAMNMWAACADPFLLPPMQVDKGAIKFILSGANVMCPGLTSPGARMTDVQSETVVVSFCYCATLQFCMVCSSCICLYSKW